MDIFLPNIDITTNYEPIDSIIMLDQYFEQQGLKFGKKFIIWFIQKNYKSNHIDSILINEIDQKLKIIASKYNINLDLINECEQIDELEAIKSMIEL